MMLVLTRKIDQGIVIAGNICVRVLEVERGRVKIGISAPPDVPVLREELPSREEEQFSPSAVGGAQKNGSLARPHTYVDALRGVLAQLDTDAIEAIAEALIQAREANRAVFIVGNGGSASTASHMATDLCKVTAWHGQPGVRAMSLPDNVALLTAWSNDEGYDQSFAGPVEAYVSPDDVLIAISASGNSPNVLEATRVANRIGAVTIGLTGFGGGELASLAQISIVVPADNYGLVEDAHLAINHALTEAIKARIRYGRDIELAKAA